MIKFMLCVFLASTLLTFNPGYTIIDTLSRINYLLQIMSFEVLSFAKLKKVLYAAYPNFSLVYT